MPCSHVGYVDDARSIFSTMMSKYNIQPNERHTGCMIDVLSRAGNFEEAEMLIGIQEIQYIG